MLRLAGLEVVSDPDRFVIGTPGFRVRIAPACSGYEGIGLIWVFLAAYLWLFRRRLRFPRALLLLPIGTVVDLAGQLGADRGPVVLGTFGSKAVALGGFHSQAGWLAFNAVGLGLVLGSHRSSVLPSGPGPGAGPGRDQPVGGLSRADAGDPGRDDDHRGVLGRVRPPLPVRIAAASLVLWHYRREYADLRRTWSWGSAAIGLAVFAIWMALEPAPTRAGRGPWPRRLADCRLAVAWLASRVFGSVLVVPLAEELAFRGFLLRRLIGADFTDDPGRFTWTSFVISSALFGALHGRWLAGTIAGRLRVALYRRRELADAVAAHATTNALIAAYVLATGSWSMWS